LSRNSIANRWLAQRTIPRPDLVPDLQQQRAKRKDMIRAAI
jgi:hypothetical protein